LFYLIPRRGERERKEKKENSEGEGREGGRGSSWGVEEKSAFLGHRKDSLSFTFPPLVPVSSLAPGCPFHQTLLCPLSFYQSSLPPPLLSKPKIEYRQVLEPLPRGRATLSDSTERALKHTPCKKISLSFCLSLSQRKSCREGATFFSFLFPRGLYDLCRR